MRRRANEPCFCGSGAKLKRCHLDRRALARPLVELGLVGPRREVPTSIIRPPYVDGGRMGPATVQIHDQASLARLRIACRIAAEVLLETAAAVAPGVSTDELDEIAHAAYIARGAYPSTLGYKGFPKSVCTSVNEVICHGIPDSRALRDGDVVNIDVTAYAEGMHGDTSATIVVGQGHPTVLQLVDTTRRATLEGIRAIAPGRPLRAVAEAIVPFVDQYGYDIIAEYGGHGIGSVFHAAPHVNHTIEPRDRALFQVGMSLTVEPMLTSGEATFHQAPDGWTEFADDGLPSAQFEHTVIVTDCGVEILTVTADGRTAVGTLDER